MAVDVAMRVRAAGPPQVPIWRQNGYRHVTARSAAQQEVAVCRGSIGRRVRLSADQHFRVVPWSRSFGADSRPPGCRGARISHRIMTFPSGGRWHEDRRRAIAGQPAPVCPADSSVREGDRRSSRSSVTGSSPLSSSDLRSGPRTLLVRAPVPVRHDTSLSWRSRIAPGTRPGSKRRRTGAGSDSANSLPHRLHRTTSMPWRRASTSVATHSWP